MNKIWLFLILTVIQFSCQEKEKNHEDTTDINVVNSLESDEVFTNNMKVDIYELDYENREFPGVNGFKRKERVVRNKSMDYFDFIALKSIINDSSSYTTFGSACFHPNIGIVVYDKDSNLLSELYICMHCNNSELYDNDSIFFEVQRQDGKYGFSNRARKKMRNLIKSYGFETKHTYSLFYDYPKDYLDNQIRNGRDSTDVVNEILEHYEQYEDNYSQELNKLDTISYSGWRARSADFFKDENIGSITYEYDVAGGDKFTSYLGKISINESVYHVCNVFRRVQAAIVLHGHSSLYFLNDKYEIAAEYSISIPDELPKGIIENKLEFHIEGSVYLVDSIDLSLPYLCIKQGVLCVPKVE